MKQQNNVDYVITQLTVNSKVTHLFQAFLKAATVCNHCCTWE